MKRMKIAVLDDGVCINSTVHISQLSFDMQCLNGQVQSRSLPVLPGSHGTIVADLINAYAKDVQIGSVKVMEPGKRGSICDTVQAAKWCVANGADVIHMSIGTSQWQDFLLMEREMILLAAEVCIVAARNNSGEFSLPSGLPGVWDVSFRRGGSRVKVKQRNVYGNTFSIEADLPVPEMAALKYGSCVGYSNSYQAALVTGFFAEKGLLLQGTQEALSEALVQQCIDEHTYKALSELSVGRGAGHYLEDIAIVWIQAAYEDTDEIFDLLTQFHRNDYYAVVAAEWMSGVAETIFWHRMDALSRENLSRLAERYQCDLLLVVSQKEDKQKLADYTLCVSDSWLHLYGKKRQLLASSKKLTANWQQKAVEMIISQYDEED